MHISYDYISLNNHLYILTENRLENEYAQFNKRLIDLVKEETSDRFSIS